MKITSALAEAKNSVMPVLAMVEDTVARIDVVLEEDAPMNSFLCRSLLRLGQGVDSVFLLSSRNRYQDMWALCRSLCELATNTCYLQVAPRIEFRRWSNYDLWTDERLISGLSSFVPEFDGILDASELERQRELRKSLDESGLYLAAKGGSWSEKSLEKRAQIADSVLNLERNVFELLYRLTVKIGNSFVHVSPKGVGNQATPIRGIRALSPQEAQATTQSLAMSVTAVYAAVNFTRFRKGMSEHPLAGSLGRALTAAFDGSM